MTAPDVANVNLTLICPVRHKVGVLIRDESFSPRVGGPRVDYVRECGNRLEWAVEDINEFTEKCDACGVKAVGAPVAGLKAAVGVLSHDAGAVADTFSMELYRRPGRQ